MRDYTQQSNANPIRRRAALEAKIPADRSGCWTWTGQHTSAGYGTMRTGPGQRDYVHRVSYSMYVAAIPDGFELDHLCRNRLCFNPKHLEPVRPRINFRRGVHPNAVAAVNDRCRADLHDLVGANIVWNPSGTRRCRECNREWQRQKYAARQNGRSTHP